ncbi:NF-kappa-B-repressing factor-like [Saccostrea echinata]|uniref:NF-kappa-B-repressing factor-like n=1 Tax=Saccostrea echinata TaxID=191078 RepID=UPI002A7EA971|nr:NF-kappa-B-repressing factor-like [Saccostrea echinata]
MDSSNMSQEDIPSVVEKFRSPYESQVEWDLRRAFMIANYGTVSMESLVCLANCYLNVEMYGCRYPKLVMDKIKEMSSELNSHNSNKTENAPKRIKGLETVKFVKQSEAQPVKKQTVKPSLGSEPSAKGKTTNKTSVASSGKPQNQATNSNSTPKAASKKTVAPSFHFVRASTEFHSTDVATESVKQKMREDFLESCQPQPVVHPQLSAQNSQQKTGLGFSKKGKSPNVVGPEIPTNSFISEEENQFHAFANHYATYKKNHSQRSPVDIFHMVATKTRMKIDTQFSDVSVKGKPKFVCTVIIDNIEVATGEDSNKKGAKNKAFEIGQEKLSRKYLKVVRVNPEKQELQAFDEEPKSEPGFIAEEPVAVAPKPGHRKRKESELHGDLTRFIIFERSNMDQNAISILQNSAAMNHANLEYDFHVDMSGTRCRVLLEGHNLVEYMGTTKATSKSIASEKALERLRQICYTIKIKQAVDSSESDVGRDEVMGEIQKQVSAIPDDNIGSRLLKKMGWTGGGVGAEGNKGLAEPVAVTLTNHTLLNRQGLGLHGDHAKAMVDFKKKITEVIDNYAKSDKQEDLAFAPEFSKEERAFIHQYSQKLGLKTQSRGSGNERYLTISRKRSVSQLFDHIMEEGGSTQKYELIAPLYDS